MIFRLLYSSSGLSEGRLFVELLFERKLRNAVYGCVVYGAVSSEEALKVLRPTSVGRGIVSEEALSIRTAQGSSNPVDGPIHYFWSLYCFRDQRTVGTSWPGGISPSALQKVLHARHTGQVSCAR